jgi:hypothetical protein
VAEREASVARSCTYVAQGWLLLLCCKIGCPTSWLLLLLLSLLQHCHMLEGQSC